MVEMGNGSFLRRAVIYHWKRGQAFLVSVINAGTASVSPADQTRQESHAQIRITGPNADREAVHTTLRACRHGFKRKTTSIVLFDRFHGRQNSVDKIAGRVEPSQIKLNSDVLLQERTEMNACTHLNFRSNCHRTLGASLDGIDTDVGPFLVKTTDPDGERLRPGRVVQFQGAVMLVSLQINLGVVLDHPVRVDKGTDGSNGSLHVFNPLSR